MGRFLLINPRSGDSSPGPEELAAAARARGVETHVLADGDDPGELARASDAAVVGAAGGDGSLAAVAQAALDTDAAFVCIPFGTRNHFARDVGLDRDDPLGALAAFDDDAVERRIDVGRVGDRLFLNNVSLGAYARLVHRREHHRRREDALCGIRALLKTARHRHHLHARANGEAISARVLLVGNNRYELDLFTLGNRRCLDAGELHVCAAAGWLPRAWDERVGPRFELELDHARVHAAIDGEPTLLEPPFEIESLHRRLRVLLPAGAAG
ncbi:MAG TPA: diacylglycerol kinase family protein [Gaiellaceae bacterium]|nr:diacylglycerol kinase family protein [Gaiellaceae bacterium]